MSKFLSNCVIRQRDLNLIFVIGFTFLIMAINIEMGLEYFGFIILSFFFLMIHNALIKSKEENQNGKS